MLSDLPISLAKRHIYPKTQYMHVIHQHSVRHAGMSTSLVRYSIMQNKPFCIFMILGHQAWLLILYTWRYLLSASRYTSCGTSTFIFVSHPEPESTPSSLSLRPIKVRSSIFQKISVKTKIFASLCWLNFFTYTNIFQFAIGRLVKSSSFGSSLWKSGGNDWGTELILNT